MENFIRIQGIIINLANVSFIKTDAVLGESTDPHPALIFYFIGETYPLYIQGKKEVSEAVFKLGISWEGPKEVWQNSTL